MDGWIVICLVSGLVNGRIVGWLKAPAGPAFEDSAPGLTAHEIWPGPCNISHRGGESSRGKEYKYF